MLESLEKDLAFPIMRFFGSGLYELRDRSCGFRIYYTFIGNTLAILLVLGDKTTQASDIDRARVRRTKLLESKEGVKYV